MGGSTVLVTGATGYIAGHVIADLLAHGYTVRATARSLRDPQRFAHLRVLGGDLELVEADLTSDRGWADAVAGCDYVQHVASPFPGAQPRDENELIRPAVDGTLRVLRAAAAEGVRRVVVTSSIAAITAGRRAEQRVRTEDDWSELEGATAYQKSKTLAERAAWDFARAHPDLEVVTVNPGAVLGPVQHAAVGTSVSLVRRLLHREMPAVPRLGFAPVDVRDVAVAHRLAMESPKAPGNRYICAGTNVWVEEMAAVLAAEFGPLGFRVPTARMPHWLLWAISRVDPDVRSVVHTAGRPEQVSADKASTELDWHMRPIQDTLIDTAHSLIHHGIVTSPKGPAYQR